MIKRLAFILSALALLNGLMGVRMMQRSNWAMTHLSSASLLLFAYYLLQLASPIGHRIFAPNSRDGTALKTVHRVIDWASYLALGLLPCFFLYSIAADVVGFLYFVSTSPRSLTIAEDVAQYNLVALTAIFIATAITAVAGIIQASMTPRVREVDVPLLHLPQSFDEFKIAQISDLHIGPFLKRDFTEKVTAITNALLPDMIALTGDFADGLVANLGEALTPLAGLQARSGIFFVTGNHEYYWGASAWSELFTSFGIRVLSNEHVILKRDDEAILVAGVPDYSTRHLKTEGAISPELSLEGAPPHLTKILLAHQPVSYRMAEAAGFDLQLSGHTHGGQYFPFNIIVKFFQPYLRGLYRYKNLWIYVSTGTGFWGPPLRAGVPGQVALLTLRRTTK